MNQACNMHHTSRLLDYYSSEGLFILEEKLLEHESFLSYKMPFWIDIIPTYYITSLPYN